MQRIVSIATRSTAIALLLCQPACTMHDIGNQASQSCKKVCDKVCYVCKRDTNDSTPRLVETSKACKKDQDC